MQQITPKLPDVYTKPHGVAAQKGLSAGSMQIELEKSSCLVRLF